MTVRSVIIKIYDVPSHGDGGMSFYAAENGKLTNAQEEHIDTKGVLQSSWYKNCEGRIYLKPLPDNQSYYDDKNGNHIEKQPFDIDVNDKGEVRFILTHPEGAKIFIKDYEETIEVKSDECIMDVERILTEKEIKSLLKID